MNIYLKRSYLYPFFILFSLTYFFLSTNYAFSKNLIIENIQIKENFDDKFDRNEVINKGFKEAFRQLTEKIIQSQDQKKIINLKLKSIKILIENFSIKEEQFLNNEYYVSLDVEFNKRRIFNLFEQNNIFPALPKKKKVMFIPILIDEENNDLLLFSENDFYNNWITEDDKKNLLEYVLPSEDLEDINFIREKFSELENYDFKEIINKYDLDSYIISLFYKNSEKVRILSKINLNNRLILDNQVYVNFQSEDELKLLIKKIKVKFNDFWKKENQVNTSIKLPLIISVDLKDNQKIKKFEKIIDDLDLVSKFYISKIDNQKVYYTLIYNGTPKAFLSNIEELGYQIDFKNKIWNFR